MPDNKKLSDYEFKSSGFMLAVNLAILSDSKDAEIVSPRRGLISYPR